MKGHQSEDRVVEELERLGWKIIDRRLKNPFAEIDILALDEGGRLSIIEVKSVTHSDYLDIISREQWKRLERAAESLRFQHQGDFVPALLYLAAVNQEREVDLILLDPMSD